MNGEGKMKVNIKIIDTVPPPLIPLPCESVFAYLPVSIMSACLCVFAKREM